MGGCGSTIGHGAYHEVRIPGNPGIRTLRLRMTPKEVRDSRTMGFPSPAGALPVWEKSAVPGLVRAVSLSSTTIIRKP